MSTLTEATTSPARDRSTPPIAAHAAQGQVRRRVSLLVTLVVLVWSTIQLVNLADRHTTGPQIYGILVAVAAVAAGVLSLLLVWTARRGVRTTAAVLLLWAVVAFGGIAGTVAHVLVPWPGQTEVDLSRRPVTAPMTFFVLGVAGGAALFYAQRRAEARTLKRS